jgi:hypothetical protein
MKKIIISIAIALVVIAGIALMVLYNLGDRMIEEGIEQALNESLEQEDLLTEAENPGAGSVQEQTNTGPAGSQQANESQGQGNTAASTSTQDAGEKGTGNQPKQNAAPAPKPAISRDQIVEVKDRVSAIDKISAGTLILKRLSPSDLSELKGMLSNGVSSEEKSRAKAMVYQRFTPDEVKEIKAMYSKYMK